MENILSLGGACLPLLTWAPLPASLLDSGKATIPFPPRYVVLLIDHSLFVTMPILVLSLPFLLPGGGSGRPLSGRRRHSTFLHRYFTYSPGRWKGRNCILPLLDIPPRLLLYIYLLVILIRYHYYYSYQEFTAFCIHCNSMPVCCIGVHGITPHILATLDFLPVYTATSILAFLHICYLPIHCPTE